MPDPLEQYGRIAQIQQAQNQNALAQYQINSAKRADETNTNFLSSLRAAGDDPARVRQALINAGKVKEAGELDVSALTRQETQGRILKQQRENVDRMKLDLGKNPSKENITAYMQDIDADPTFSPAAKAIAKRGLDQMLGMTVDQRKQSLLTSGMTGAEMSTAGIAEKKLVAPDPFQIERADGSKIFVDKNPNSPTFKQEILPAQAAGMTPFQTQTLGISQQNLGVAQGNLKVAQNRLAKEGTTLDPAENAAISRAIIEGRLDPNRVNGRNAKILATTLLANPDANVLELGVSASGATAAERSLATQTAKMSTAANEANKMIDVVRNLSDKVNRTEYPTINAVSNAVSKGTGGTEIVQLNTSINALVNSYARAISPTGQPTVSDKNHAREVINSAYSTGQISAILDVMQQEMAIAREAAGTASTELKESREKARGRGAAAAVTPSAGFGRATVVGN
jgi:hypothetical protein